MTAYATRLDRSNPIRLAVVGAGRMGRRHIAAAGTRGGRRARRGLRPRARCRRGGGPARRRHGTRPRRLGEPVDAVVIAAPTPFHTSLAEQAIGMGPRRAVREARRLRPRRDRAAGRAGGRGGARARRGILAADGVAVRRGPPAGRRGRDRHSHVPALVAVGRRPAAARVRRPGRCRAASRWTAACTRPTWRDGSWAARSRRSPPRARRARWRRSATPRRSRPWPSPPPGQAVAIDLGRTCGYDDDVRTEILGPGGALLIDARGRGGLRHGDQYGLRDVPGPDGDVLELALAAQLERFAEACRGVRSRTRRRPTPPARSRPGRRCAAPASRAAPSRCSRVLPRLPNALQSLQQFRAGGKGRTWYLLGPGSGACAALAVARTMEPPRVAPQDVPTSSRW